MFPLEQNILPVKVIATTDTILNLNFHRNLKGHFLTASLNTAYLVTRDHFSSMNSLVLTFEFDDLVVCIILRCFLCANMLYFRAKSIVIK